MNLRDNGNQPELQNLMIGPAWTYGAAPKPLGSKDMGTWTSMVYTPEQL